MFEDIFEKNRKDFDDAVSHPLQSYEWGEFREQTGVKVLRRAIKSQGKLTQAYTLTLHKIPFFGGYIGYLPKGDLPSKDLLDELKQTGKKHNCAYIEFEPNVTADQSAKLNKLGLVQSFHPLFTRYTFVLDLTPSEEDLLKNMHHKTRYNIRVAKKHEVEIVEDSSDKAFEKYLELTWETTKRQKFYAHTKEYHRKMWATLNSNPNGLRAHLFLAKYQNKILATWILFVFKDTLYYPYGASSSEHRETMASNLMMWEAIIFGKKLGLKKLDMWGALGENPDPKDPWYGFHRFKQGYGATLTEFAGSYDLVLNSPKYQILKVADKARSAYLKIKKFR